MGSTLDVTEALYIHHISIPRPTSDICSIYQRHEVITEAEGARPSSEHWRKGESGRVGTCVARIIFELQNDPMPVAPKIRHCVTHKQGHANGSKVFLGSRGRLLNAI